MKKTYKNPLLEVIKIQTTKMLAGSPELGGEYGGATPEGREDGFEW